LAAGAQVIQVRLSESKMLLPVRVTPRGGKDCLLPYLAEDSVIKIKVSSPPEDGKANAAVLKLLADVCDLPKSRLQVASGEKSRSKQVAILLSSPADAETMLTLNRLATAMQTEPSDCFQVVAACG